LRPENAFDETNPPITVLLVKGASYDRITRLTVRRFCRRGEGAFCEAGTEAHHHHRVRVTSESKCDSHPFPPSPLLLRECRRSGRHLRRSAIIGIVGAYANGDLSQEFERAGRSRRSLARPHNRVTRLHLSGQDGPRPNQGPSNPCLRGPHLLRNTLLFRRR